MDYLSTYIFSNLLFVSITPCFDQKLAFIHSVHTHFIDTNNIVRIQMPMFNYQSPTYRVFQNPCSISCYHLPICINFQQEMRDTLMIVNSEIQACKINIYYLVGLGFHSGLFTIISKLISRFTRVDNKWSIN